MFAVPFLVSLVFSSFLPSLALPISSLEMYCAQGACNCLNLAIKMNFIQCKLNLIIPKLDVMFHPKPSRWDERLTFCPVLEEGLERARTPPPRPPCELPEGEAPRPEAWPMDDSLSQRSSSSLTNRSICSLFASSVVPSDWKGCCIFSILLLLPRRESFFSSSTQSTVKLLSF